MKLNNKGFTVYELLIAFVFLIVISFFLLTTIFSVRDKQQLTNIKGKLVDLKMDLTKEIEDDLITYKIKTIANCGSESYCINITYSNDAVKKLQVINTTDTKKIIYGASEYILYTDSYFIPPFTVTAEVTPSADIKRKNGILKIIIPVEHPDIKGDYGIRIIHMYNSNDYNFGSWTFQ